MAQQRTPLILIVISILIWILWEQDAYPFSLRWFSHDGYGIHLVAGIGWTAFQVWSAYALLPERPSTRLFWAGHALIATGILMLHELQQYFDPTRQVQFGDIVFQTIGVLIAILLLQCFEQKRSDALQE